MIYTYLNYKITKLSYFFGIYINLILDFFILWFLYHQELKIACVIFIIKNLWFCLTPKLQSTSSFNYHIYNGINILLKSIHKRGKILIFYVFIYNIIYILLFYMLYNKELLALYLSIFLYISKIFISLAFLKLSQFNNKKSI